MTNMSRIVNVFSPRKSNNNLSVPIKALFRRLPISEKHVVFCKYVPWRCWHISLSSNRREFVNVKEKQCYFHL